MENLWHTMKLHLGHETEEELFHNIQHVWHSLKHKYIQNLVSSMALTRRRTDQTRAVRLWGVVVWAFSPFSLHCEIERVNRSQKNKENSNYKESYRRKHKPDKTFDGYCTTAVPWRDRSFSGPMGSYTKWLALDTLVEG
jgi:hypothetical protein